MTQKIQSDLRGWLLESQSCFSGCVYAIYVSLNFAGLNIRAFLWHLSGEGGENQNLDWQGFQNLKKKKTNNVMTFTTYFHE